MTDQTESSVSNFYRAENHITTLVAANPVVIFSTDKEFAMCHTLEKLFHSLAVSPKVYVLDKCPWDKEMERALIEKNESIPVVYIRGKLVGNTTQVMTSHIQGKLAELIKEPAAEDRIESLVAENAVVIFSTSNNRAMCDNVEELFCKWDITPTVYELDQYPWGKEVETALIEKNGSIPAVYIGGQLVRKTTQVTDSHFAGTLLDLRNKNKKILRPQCLIDS